MIPLLDHLAHADTVAARGVGESAMRGPRLKVGTAPMWLRIHNNGGLGPTKLSS